MLVAGAVLIPPNKSIDYAVSKPTAISPFMLPGENLRYAWGAWIFQPCFSESLGNLGPPTPVSPSVFYGYDPARSNRQGKIQEQNTQLWVPGTGGTRTEVPAREHHGPTKSRQMKKVPGFAA